MKKAKNETKKPRIAYKTCAACGVTYGPEETDVCTRCGETSLLAVEDAILKTNSLPVFHEIYGDTSLAVGESQEASNLQVAI